MTEIDVARHSRLVDPVLHVWGWEIPTYLFLGGMAAGIMFLSALMLARPGERSRAARWMPLAAPLLLSAGMVALFLDLEHELYVWRFYLAFRWTSPMSWGAWILMLVYPVTVLFGLAALSDADADWVATRVSAVAPAVRALRGWALPRMRLLRILNLVVGVGLGGYTGVLLSTLGARALWGSALLGPLFLVSGISSGAALAMMLGVSAEERRFLARADLHAIGLEVALILFMLAGLATGGASSRAAADLLLGGPYTAPFWSLVVIAGLAVPALLEALEGRLHLRASAVAPALVLLGGFSLRWILVAAGQS
jgi:formate-dependent nitrite reductase membrane component NrfD